MRQVICGHVMRYIYPLARNIIIRGFFPFSYLIVRKPFYFITGIRWPNLSVFASYSKEINILIRYVITHSFTGCQKPMRRSRGGGLEAVRVTVARSRKTKDMMYCRVLCFARILPNATRLSLLIAYGVILRTAHLLSPNRLLLLADDIVNLICEKIPADVPLLQRKSASLWYKFVDCVMSSGPLGTQYGGGGVEAISAKLAEFPPSGPPNRGQQWNPGPENCMGVEELYHVLQDFIGRNSPLPVSIRWYTVDR